MHQKFYKESDQTENQPRTKVEELESLITTI